MPEPKTVIEEIEGRIATLQSQIEYEKEQIVQRTRYAEEARTIVAKLEDRQRQWKAVLASTTAAQVTR